MTVMVTTLNRTANKMASFTTIGSRCSLHTFVLETIALLFVVKLAILIAVLFRVVTITVIPG